MYSRNKDGNKSAATNNNGSNDDGQRRNTKLSYEEIIRGIGFVPEREEEQEPIPKPPEVRRPITEAPEDVDEDVEQGMEDLVTQQIESIRDEWHVPRLGDMKKTRPQGVFRIMSGNVNNMSMKVNRDGKIARIRITRGMGYSSDRASRGGSRLEKGNHPREVECVVSIRSGRIQDSIHPQYMR